MTNINWEELLSATAIGYVDRLVALGLFGKSRSEVIARLVDNQLNYLVVTRQLGVPRVLGLRPHAAPPDEAAG